MRRGCDTPFGVVLLAVALINMPLGRLVPWSGWDEWQRVRAGLFSTDTAQLRRALHQVSAWEARGKLPLGADLTAVIQRICLRDPGHVGSEQQTCQVLTAEQESMLRMQYALAIIRLVNGISDSAQKGTVAKSVAYLAETAGLPRILVDIRHEASHNELPSLALLRLGAASALAWLSQSYWQQQANHVTLRKSQIHELLQKYVDSQKESLGQGQHPGAACGQPHEEGNEAVRQPEAAGTAAAGQKLRREILSQLLSKVQSNAASLVEPLFDTGLLDVNTACSEVSQGPTAKPALAAALWQATMRDLTAVWPSLCQRLLARAVQHIAGAHGCWKSQAWVQLLLSGHPKRDREAGPGHKSKKRRKGGEDLHQDQIFKPLWAPSKRLMMSSLSTCIQASAPAAEDTPEGTSSPSALQSCTKIILGKLHSAGGNSPPALLALEHLQTLTNLASTTISAAKSDSLRDGADNTPGMSAAAAIPIPLSKAVPLLREASAGQHMLLQHHKPSMEPGSQRRSGWQVAESWAPCAIGMVPSADSPTGRAPNTSLVLPDGIASEPPQCRVSTLQAQHSSRPGSEAQAACGSEVRHSQRPAEGHALDDALWAHVDKVTHTVVLQGKEKDRCSNPRCEEEQLPQADFVDSGILAQGHDKHDGLQDQHELLQQHFALAKPVRLL